MAGGGFAVFVSLALGLLFLLWGKFFSQYLMARAAGRPFPTGFFWPDGREKTYFELDGFTAWGDMGFFCLGVALLFEAVAFTLATLRVRGSRNVMWFSVALSTAALLVNLYAVVRMIGFGIIPQISIVALLIAGLSASYQVSVARAR